MAGIRLAAPVALEHDEDAIAMFDGAYEDFRMPARIFVGIVIVLRDKLARRKPEKPV